MAREEGLGGSALLYLVIILSKLGCAARCLG